MDLSERCELTDLFKDQCAHCRKIEDPEVEALKDEQAFDRWLDSL